MDDAKPAPRQVLEQKHIEGLAVLGRLYLQQKHITQQIETLERELASLSNVASLFPDPVAEPRE